LRYWITAIARERTAPRRYILDDREEFFGILPQNVYIDSPRTAPDSLPAFSRQRDCRRPHPPTSASWGMYLLATGLRCYEFREDQAEADVSIWQEALFAADILLLHASPVYYGLGVPRGDGSAVVVVPGFLGTDAYLTHLHTWLGRIGYRPYFSGIGFNAECPNILIKQRLTACIEKALDETNRKIHLIGHSLGGIIARSFASQRPNDVASVTTLASPFRGTVAHRTVLQAANAVRHRILKEHGSQVLPTCYTGQCTCNFLDSLRRSVPDSVLETAIYTRNDGIVDWRYCVSGKPGVDFEVPGTHIGLSFNSSAYTVIANRLAQSRQSAPPTQ
jgi:triacylglycerol lipase